MFMGSPNEFTYLIKEHISELYFLVLLIARIPRATLILLSLMVLENVQK